MNFNESKGNQRNGKYKENQKYIIVSMRINDEEKLALQEMTRQSCTSISLLMREAIHHQLPTLFKPIHRIPTL
jgi:hypothetical protein